MITATTTTLQRVLLWLAPSLVTVALLVFAADAALDSGVPGLPWIPLLLGAPLVWFSYLSVPRRLIVEGTDLILDRPIGKASLPIRNIRRVNARAWNRGFVVISAARRKIFLFRNTRNLAAIVGEIRRQNPAAVVVGEVPSAA
jgi:hypothetical protein